MSRIMGRQRSASDWHQFVQISSSIGLVIAGVMAPISVSAQSLQSQAEEFSRNCVQRVTQPEIAQPERLQPERLQPEIAQALSVCQQAVALTQITDDRRLEAYSLGNLGTLYLQQQNYQQAQTFYQQALAISETMGDLELRTKVLVALGTTYLQSGQHQQAFVFYQQALANASASDDLTGTAIAHYNLGLTYDTVGQYQESVNAYQNAALMAQKIGDPILETYALNKLKLAQALIEDNEQAAKL